MANVYLARVRGPADFVRHVIVKSIRSPSDHAQAMFLDEARVLAALHHQNIAQVYDLLVTDAGQYLLVMEYVHGHTVQAVLRRAEIAEFRIPLDFALTVVEAVAMGLHHAHERRDDAGRPRGIVHRDVTPGNIIAAFDGAVKLIDFGIATAFERETETQSGVIKGKTRYMAPEQASGSAVDRRADVFGLGVVLYELTTQVRAFPLAGPLEILDRTIRPPSEVRAGYYPILEDIVMTATARDGGYRFPDADAMARAVRAAAVQLGLTLGPAAIMRTMGRLFEEHDEPWLIAGRDAASDATDAAAAITRPRTLLDPPLAADREGPSWGTDVRPVRARRHPVSWGVVPATGALADWEVAVETADSTTRFLAIEMVEDAADPAGPFAVGTSPNPRLVARAELDAGRSEELLLDVEEILELPGAGRRDEPAPLADATEEATTADSYDVVVEDAYEDVLDEICDDVPAAVAAAPASPGL
ncbi:MAG: serine/threonine protein kinase, partial [Myxococcales bacterium]|nr:serine/threonine protein kinase [Myxococcales bacterium]